MTIAEPLPGAAVGAFWDRLAARGPAPALLTEHGAVTYAELAVRVAALADRLGPTRRLVVLEARNDVDTVVGYLACLAGQHPVLLVDAANPAAAESAVSAYDPDVVLGDGLLERRPGTAHDLHPDLALLLSTSGSTGSPKLVRLSRTNVTANASAIAEYLRIRSSDVAATTLPLHYCYGLSVLTSHLSAGAAVLLTPLSVVDPCFWELVRAQEVTTFPGVPHTFELLDRVGFAEMELPSLRYLTCAGGRLPPEVVRRFAALGQQRGFDLFVMYGATEATSRMAYLPPDLALAHPHTIGVPIPGGSLSIDEGGQLVFQGDNVMLGYAESAAALARGRDITSLKTGDLARRTPEGLFEIVGRVSRFAKAFGLRIDLGRVEDILLAAGVVGYAADAGDRVVVAVDGSATPVDGRHVQRVAAEGLGLPRAALQVVVLDSVPRVSSGKPDYRAILDRAGAHPAGRAGVLTGTNGSTPPEGDTGGSAGAIFAAVLGREDVRDQDSFVSLGGDSLSYVETSLRLEAVLGHLPAGWHQMTVADLEQRTGTRQRRRGRTMETNVLLRAVAIIMIVGSHSNLFVLLGGAHLLVGLAGFNFGRFQLTDRPRRDRVRGLSASITRIVVPSVLWLSFAAAASTKYDLLNVTLLNGVFGSREWSESWHYWFIEALVWTLVALTALLSLPAVDRVERRWPFWLPFGLAVLALLTRYDVVRLFGGDSIHRAHVLFWLFALGWAAVKTSSRSQRLLVSAVVAVTVPGFFAGGQPLREAAIVAGMLLLVWVPSVRVPALVARCAGVVASASLYIYLCHWQIYPAYEFRLPWLATGLSLAAGILFWRLVVWCTPRVERAAGGLAGEIWDSRRWLSLRRFPTRDELTAPLEGAAR